MAKKIMVKCKYCNQSFNRADPDIKIVKIERRYAHKECYDKFFSVCSKEEMYHDKMNAYLKTIFGDKANFIRINSQIKEFQKKYNYTYQGMYASLLYFYQVKQQSTEKANGGIGIIPYVYQEANEYFDKLLQAQKINKDAKQYNIKTEEITIESPRMNVRRPHLWFEEEDEKNGE